MTFTETSNPNIYRVWSGDEVVGTVRKSEAWTVRGKSIRWAATRAGKYLGSFPTRKEAAAVLAA